MLADHFLFRINCKLGKKLQQLDTQALTKLIHHNWPGNVRELKNVIERAAILCDTTIIGVESILFSFDLSSPPSIESSNPVAPQERDTLSHQLDALEHRIVVKALKSAKSIRQAAVRLGISHTTLRNKIRKHRL